MLNLYHKLLLVKQKVLLTSCIEMSDTQEKKSRGRSITLHISEQKYMELLIKIRHENLNWKKFFGFLINGFVEDDPRIIEYIDLQMMNIRAKSRTKVLQKESK